MSTYLLERDGSGTHEPASISSSEKARCRMDRALAITKRMCSRAQVWWQSRQLLGADEEMLKDIGIPRCGIDWAVRNGRG